MNPERIPVGLRLLALIVLSTAVIVVDLPMVNVVVVVAAAIAAHTSGVPRRSWRRLAVPVASMALLVGLLQLVTGHPDDGVHSAARLLAIGSMAITFTLTTPAAMLVAWVESMLRRFGLRPDRIFRAGLVVGLTTRGIDHLADVAGRVIEARRARGLQRSARAFAVPMVVEAARFAHGVGEALDARGIADRPEMVPSVAPYRMVARVTVGSGGRSASARWTPTGGELGPCAQRPDAVPPHLIIEAGVQLAGHLMAAGSDETGRRWLLAGIDDLEVRPGRWDEPVDVAARLDRHVGGIGRVLVESRQDRAVLAMSTVLMAAFEPSVGADE